jgi:transcriptional regulator with XRE-family HTH domain
MYATAYTCQERVFVDRMYVDAYIVNMSPVGLRVRELREGRGWTQAELARRAGIRRATVNRIENARIKSIDLEVLEKLATALEVHPAALIEKKD